MKNCKQENKIYLEVFTQFRKAIKNPEIYFNDSGYINFLDKIVFNVLDDETYTHIMDNINNEKIFYESFYLAFKLIDRDFEGFKDLKYFDIALNYLHHFEYFDHYFVLDYFLEIY